MDEIDEAAKRIAGILTRNAVRPSFDTGLHGKTKERAKMGRTHEGSETKLQTCKNPECGEQFIPYKRGAVWQSLCPECWKASISKGRDAAALKRALEPITDKSVVIIRFSEDDGPLFENLQSQAKIQRRSIDQHILYLVEQAIDREGE